MNLFYVSLEVYRSFRSILSSRPLQVTSRLQSFEGKLKALSLDEIDSLAQDYFRIHLEQMPVWSPIYWIERSISSPIFNRENHPCMMTSHAVMGLNLFQQKYVKKISTLTELENELQNEEEGTFQLSITGPLFLEDSKDSSKWDIFPGHDFVLIKVIENEKVAYRLVQSYVKQFSLREFIDREGYYYPDFDSLKKQILEPLQKIVQHRDPWTADECEAWNKITGIDPIEWIGFWPKNVTHSLGFLGGRTTNYEPPLNQTSVITTAKHAIAFALTTFVLGSIAKKMFPIT